MKYLILITVVMPSNLFSQLNINAVICNSQKRPLPLTNVVSLKSNNGTVTGENGRFGLNGLTSTDSIKITNISYLPLIAPVNGNQITDTFFLTEKISQLDEVSVTASKKYKLEAQLGYLNYDNRGEFKLRPGSQIALFVQNTIEKVGLIKGISFRLKQKGACKNGLRIRVLSKGNLTTDPYLDMLHEDIVLANQDLKFKNYVDLVNYNISLPVEGFFVVIEFLEPETDCNQNSFTSLSANLGEGQNLVWLNYRDRKWIHTSIPRGDSQNYMTPNISVKIAY